MPSPLGDGQPRIPSRGTGPFYTLSRISNKTLQSATKPGLLSGSAPPCRRRKEGSHLVKALFDASLYAFCESASLLWASPGRFSPRAMLSRWDNPGGSLTRPGGTTRSAGAEGLLVRLPPSLRGRGRRRRPRRRIATSGSRSCFIESVQRADSLDFRSSNAAQWPPPVRSTERLPKHPGKQIKSGAGSSQLNSSRKRAIWPLAANGSAATVPVPTIVPSRSRSRT